MKWLLVPALVSVLLLAGCDEPFVSSTTAPAPAPAPTSFLTNDPRFAKLSATLDTICQDFNSGNVNTLLAHLRPEFPHDVTYHEEDQFKTDVGITAAHFAGKGCYYLVTDPMEGSVAFMPGNERWDSTRTVATFLFHWRGDSWGVWVPKGWGIVHTP